MYYLLPLLACLRWGANTIVTKLAAGSVGPVDISFWRWLAAAIILLPFALPRLKSNLAVLKANWARFLVLGALGGVMFQCLAYYAAHFTSATNMGVIQALIPLIALALSRIFMGHAVRGGAVIGSIISLVGVIAVVSHGDFEALVSHGINKGDALMLLGALAFATYNLLMHKWRIPVTLIESLFLQALSATILLLPLFLVAGTGVQGGAAIGCIAFAAIGASIMAPLAWMTGLHRLGSARVAGFFNLVPIVTALLAVVVLKESLSTWVVGGGLMAVFGVVLAEYAARKKPDEVMVVDDTSTKR
ncbi:EamA/RhaT family transporter [Stenotrophomonas maltophilia]|uniref:EamA/RhaT family transporter n=1 Tax=Stenotrophomonas maltophilia TaxID=40324 RepID=A0AAX1IAF2_STEMA|nr:DMT family transporter [Stenotrophomonas maltophilia]QGL80579.1 DMT family transporter [Stenotrophomonas maltophilia]QNG76040.1 EamA/RhaT family transporter [Stenotrophomonas maltophilia]